MASFPVNNPITGSPLIGNPITVTVQPAAHHQSWTFHRIILSVYAALVVPDADDGQSDTDYTVLKFTTPVETKIIDETSVTLPVEFDISSALQAVFDRYKYNHRPPSQYPYVKFRVEAVDEYVTTGETMQTDTVFLGGLYNDETPIYFYALQGAFSDFERLTTNGESRQATKFSRKPWSVSPEVVFCGSEIVRPIDFAIGLESDYVDEDEHLIDNHPTGGPKSAVYVVPDTEGSYHIGSSGEGTGIPVYAVAKPRDGYELRLINSLGCLESLHVCCLSTKEVQISTDQYDIATRETFSQFSRGLAVKSGNHEEWRMTSGPQNEAWASWYIHELLLTQICWILIGQTWVPCHILPEETVILNNRAKAQMIEVQFTVRLDITGSPLADLRV